MQVFYSNSTFRSARLQLAHSTQIGLVPTMGALHAGHASLVQKSVEENDTTVVSIFVNPTQFGPNEDLDTYPRTLEADLELLEKMGADMVWVPRAEEIYPETASFISYSIREMDRKLCGASRPGHFNGVLQIVSILFHWVQPTHAYFGRKDYQQLSLIKRMVKELHFPISVEGCPIIREADGLAMSSRNRYLSGEERQQALFLYNTLTYIREHIRDFPDLKAIQAFVDQQLTAYPIAKLDYFEVLNGENLQPLPDLKAEFHPHAFVAAFLGTTRLIDNMSLSQGFFV